MLAGSLRAHASVGARGMRRILLVCTMLGVASVPAPSSAQAPRSPDNIRELFAYLDQCVSLPISAAGSEITLRFSLTHYGALRGKPMISYSKLVGDGQAQADFVAAALRALEDCTPIPVTESFGRIVGQQVLTWRLRAIDARRT